MQRMWPHFIRICKSSTKNTNTHLKTYGTTMKVEPMQRNLEEEEYGHKKGCNQCIVCNQRNGSVVHLSLRSARNTMGIRGTPE